MMFVRLSVRVSRCGCMFFPSRLRLKYIRQVVSSWAAGIQFAYDPLCPRANQLILFRPPVSKAVVARAVIDNVISHTFSVAEHRAIGKTWRQARMMGNPCPFIFEVWVS